MRRFTFAIAMLCAIAGCDNVVQRGGVPVQFAQPFVLGDRSWNTGEAVVKGKPTCEVRAGELGVAQQLDNGRVVEQVVISVKLSPGDSYKVLVGPHSYETKDSWFNDRDSRAIIRDMKTASIVYTEQRELTLGVNNRYREIPNKIPLDGFAAQFDACTRSISKVK